MMIGIKICTLAIFFLITYGETSDKRSLPEDCGKSRFQNNKMARIIKGERAKLGQFPWIARIGSYATSTIYFYCGGSLISKYYVVTAAHCDVQKWDIVRLGENYVDTDEDCEREVCAPPHQDIAIKKITNHKGYRPQKEMNDYSLVELDQPAEFNDFVQPICFPSEPLSRQELRSDSLQVAGWGLISTKPASEPNHLMYMTAPLLDDLPCNIIYPKTLLASQLCIGYVNGKDSCNGDSGGPVIKNVKSNGVNRAYLVGVVSFGLEECGRGPAVYTNVSFFSTWTLEIIK